ncbi:acyl-CoA carboxylase epsilon subunit [Cellulomonas sp. P22]|uniref:acyl-CoA carboxylase epsilon subunit n=1 Tax=Cellulomonas sp. P22 TaxID=3373189 RepID=UPI0037A950CE
MSSPDELLAPDVHVVRGVPDDAELAALVAGLAAARAHDGATETDAGTATAPWTDRRRTLHGHVGAVPGADVWRWSLHP